MAVKAMEDGMGEVKVDGDMEAAGDLAGDLEAVGDLQEAAGGVVVVGEAMEVVALEEAGVMEVVAQEVEAIMEAALEVEEAMEVEEVMEVEAGAVDPEVVVLLAVVTAVDTEVATVEATVEAAAAVEATPSTIAVLNISFVLQPTLAEE